MRARCGPGSGRADGASGMHGEGTDCEGCDGGQGTRRAFAERTWNIENMYMTLEVSKPSGWLNADAACRVERSVL